VYAPNDRYTRLAVAAEGYLGFGVFHRRHFVFGAERGYATVSARRSESSLEDAPCSRVSLDDHICLVAYVAVVVW
jgi:hypothetical protein